VRQGERGMLALDLLAPLVNLINHNEWDLSPSAIWQGPGLLI
jgi:hypothetical protein